MLLAAIGLSACGGGSDGTTGEAATGPLKVVGGGAAPYKHHISVSTWGTEASKVNLATAARVEHAYLVALAEKDWAKACSHISDILEQRLAARSQSFARQGCPKAFLSISKPIPGDSLSAATEVEADSLRSNGLWAFLLYRAAGKRYFMPMVGGEGEWRVNLLAPRPFNKSEDAANAPS